MYCTTRPDVLLLENQIPSNPQIKGCFVSGVMGCGQIGIFFFGSFAIKKSKTEELCINTQCYLAANKVQLKQTAVLQRH